MSNPQTPNPTRRNRRAGVIDRWRDKNDQPTARDSKGLRWQARLVDGAGKESGRSFRTKKLAQAWLDEQTADLVKGTYLDREARARTVADAITSWMAGWGTGKDGLAPSTRATYTIIVDSYIRPRWADVPLSEVRHTDVQAWVNELGTTGSKTGKKLSSATVRVAHKLLSQVLISAMRDGDLHANPAANVKLPTLARKKPRFLTPTEVERVAAAADYRASMPSQRGRRTDLTKDSDTAHEPAALPLDDNGVPIVPAATVSADGLLIRLLGATGLRFGEAAGLRIGRVDIDNRKLDVVEAVVEVNGAMIVGDTKTHQERPVPFRKSLVEPLRVQRGDRAEDAFMFPGATDGPLRLRNWSRRVFTPAAALAGVSEDVTVHWLRHSAATAALAEGKNVVEVQTLLGHAAPSITMDVYLHADPAKITAIGDD